MLKGFENITQPLSDYERGKLLPVFIANFRDNNVGPGHAVSNRAIVSMLKSFGYKVTEIQVRKVINYIRNKGLLPGLVANSDGYYITKDPEVIKKYIESLDGRANEIKRVKESMQKYLYSIIGQPQPPQRQLF
jgi:hypothetical protein